MALASVAVRSARALLNDLNGISWTDALLLPLLQEAHTELVHELMLHGSQDLKYETSPITVPAGTTVMPSLPTNITLPVHMMEGEVGAARSGFTDMEQCTFLPYVDQDAWLTYWTWREDKIQFVGATTNRSVVLRYKGTITIPEKLTDALGIIFAERYLGPRIAALAYASIGQDNAFFTSMAETALYKIVQAQVTADQRPVRRRGYRSPKVTGSVGPSGITSH